MVGIDSTQARWAKAMLNAVTDRVPAGLRRSVGSNFKSASAVSG